MQAEVEVVMVVNYVCSDAEDNEKEEDIPVLAHSCPLFLSSDMMPVSTERKAAKLLTRMMAEDHPIKLRVFFPITDGRCSVLVLLN